MGSEGGVEDPSAEQRARGEQGFDEGDEVVVGGEVLKAAQQERRRYAVEELLDVSTEDPLAPIGERMVDGDEGVARRAPPAPGEGGWVECGVEVGGERGGEGVLHDAVAHAGEGEHPVAAAGLGNAKLSSGAGSVLSGEELVAEAGEFIVSVPAVTLLL
jgi:hypothetical protein